MENSLLSIILISLGILFVPFFSRLLKVPVAVGEVLYGILLGSSVLQLIKPSQWLDFLASFGFLLLMFIAGLEVKFKEILKLPAKSKSIYTMIPVLVFILSFYAGEKLCLHPLVSVAVGAISVGIVVSVLREKRLLQSRYGKTVFLVGIIGEVLSIAVLTFYTLYI
ncbi:MAG: cation:proton antiporter, partial [Desulfurobacteriaceae bacterium]